TTVGRLQFNDILPSSFSFVNEAVNAGKIKQIVTKAIEQEEWQEVTRMIDEIKDLGFRAATESGLSVSVTDCAIIPEKDEMIEGANKKAEVIQEHFLDGLISNDERKRSVFDLWMHTTDEVAEKTWDSYDQDNVVKIMIQSGGTRASKDQVKQLAAMRGLVVDPLGNIVEMPTKSNFREGLSIFEYVTSARGSRKGLTDSAIKTADAGYLTRRLVDVAHDVIIRHEDCGTDKHVVIERNPRVESFHLRISGRVAAKSVKKGNQILVKSGDVITPEIAETISQAGVDQVAVFSPLTCELRKGMCAKCYGWDFSTRKIVEVGVPVGVIAAQSIGEPGTQLTMRVKHSGGIVGLDVTQGLPRVEELFEMRVPKSAAILADVSGKLKISQKEGQKVLTINPSDKAFPPSVFEMPAQANLLVQDGQLVDLGQQLTEGSLNINELMTLRGLLIAQNQVINAIQAVYESQGIPINDKHFEVIVRKMSDKLQIESVGDTDFLTGEIVEKGRFIDENEGSIAAGGQPATAKIMLLGITRSSLFTNSWLSAASFQHTKNVLTDAAAAGLIDHLEGLKENIIIGRLIPTSDERARIEI
ncbi:MAG TPA: DNA-directed RNA polymerase subunit beta', partial [Candidatus Woesebacteria bacterium]|nr:DNA-directed RNA polymerase subunit beta' [Candidatus Woesebacteria bacterium]